MKTVTIRYSLAEDYYYVDGFSEHRPTAWLHIDRDHALPFAFYEVKSGREEQVPEDHPMVLRYAKAEGWPANGSPEHRQQIEKSLEHARRQLAERDRQAQFWEKEITELTARLESIQ